ncbi:hypothetical protein GpartN1_g6105.t1 [Galdieria partita]|uniref:Uncharacterized protein n=1 Tax=Galdieria partita TaxID=83374 RepID=A0A9C7Q1W9_9RHOD|nr:hypothetical protein GpartN1_g6105.t1 [Galdieria partita]
MEKPSNDHPSHYDSLACSDSSSQHHSSSSKKVIYNRSRIVHMDEMIRAILPKLDTIDQERVQQCYEAWKRKQVKTHTLLHQLRNIVSSDLLQSEVERIRQEKWKRSRHSTTHTSVRRCTPILDENPKELGNSNPIREKDASHSQQNPFLWSDQHTVKRSWTKEEHFLFLQGLEEYGKGQWQAIANKIGTKTASQVRSHCKKYLMRQQKDQQSKKMKTIHDMTMESPEMQQLAKKQQQATTHRNPMDSPNLFFAKIDKESIEKKNQVTCDTQENHQSYTECNYQLQEQITKIPYFIRERRIRRLENCLQQ